MKTKLLEFTRKYFLYIFAFGVMAINFTLIFDNVVWGDEAFSGIIIRGTGFAGIYERVFYLENHPPLYYFYLELFEKVFGQRTYIYHLASLIPFFAGVVFAVVAWGKKLGHMPVLFFVSFSGLSAVCVEYNLEIRMYSLCFLFLWLCSYFSYQVISTGKTNNFIGLVIAGVLSAYTHYYGLVSSGILLFVTGVIFFIKNRKKSWIWGVGSIAAYLILYAPWLSVLFRQMGYVSSGWWMTHPDSLNEILKYIFGGAKMYKTFFAMLIVFTLIVIIADFGMIGIEKQAKSDFLIKFRKPGFTPSVQLQGMICCALTMFLVIGFSYFMCWVYKPILTSRYMYPLIPVMLTWFILAVSRIIELAKTEGAKRLVYALLTILFVIVTVIGLFDFKYFRSVTRVQEVNTGIILNEIGEVDDDTVLTSIGVQHLSWTVLRYYYPDSEIVEGRPIDASKDAGEVWSFYYTELDEGVLSEMTSRGYECRNYGKVFFGKYECYLYHFYRSE